MSMRLIHPWLALGVWSCAVCAGCSQLVDPENLEIRCELEHGQDDPCQTLGMRCGSAHICETCEPDNERCNGFDDDCDGLVDEGQDKDGDGFSWCGGGDESLRDCIDADPDVHPPRRGPDGELEDSEVCDGKDNDCNGAVDDSPNCVRVDCPAEPCPDGLSCDVDTGTCIAPRPPGSDCTSDVECDVGFCLQAEALGLQQDGRGDVSLCAAACCSDRDCAGDTVCVVAPSGVRACVPPGVSGNAAGERCGRDSDCASGRCGGDVCAESCARDADCKGQGEVCGADLAGGLSSLHTVWTCGEPRGRADGGEFCTPFDPRACVSGLCFEGFVSACAAPCGTDTDCPDTSTCQVYDDGSARYPVCSSEASSETTCCTDADCGADASCKPVGEGPAWAMRCR